MAPFYLECSALQVTGLELSHAVPCGYSAGSGHKQQAGFQRGFNDFRGFVMPTCSQTNPPQSICFDAFLQMLSHARAGSNFNLVKIGLCHVQNAHQGALL
jgi:hypothetical protein